MCIRLAGFDLIIIRIVGEFGCLKKKQKEKTTAETKSHYIRYPLNDDDGILITQRFIGLFSFVTGEYLDSCVPYS